jgi:hypothetical protein
VHGSIVGDNAIVEYGLDQKDYLLDCKKGRLNCSDTWMVDPATVGQCTGLCDKNGTLIFEGDICEDSVGTVVLILWGELYNWACKFISGSLSGIGLEFPIWHWDRKKVIDNRELEIIGNIHDNPELLEV